MTSASHGGHGAVTVSVVLPVYNAGATLLPAVRSILAQTLSDFELLVIDDGSTDAALDSLAGLSDPRLKISADGRNAGLAMRLNQGIDLARGRYIARMDQDDLSFPRRLDAQAAFLEAHPDVDLLAGRAVVFRHADQGPMGMLPGFETHAQITATPWRGLPMPHPTWMGRAEWFRRHRYWIPEFVRAEDQEILLRAMGASRYHALDVPLLAYRVVGFDRRKLQRGRRALLAVQTRHFLGAGKWRWWTLAAGLFVLKTAYDAAIALTGRGEVFYARFEQSVPAEIEREFRALVRDCGA